MRSLLLLLNIGGIGVEWVLLKCSATIFWLAIKLLVLMLALLLFISLMLLLEDTGSAVVALIQ